MLIIDIFIINCNCIIFRFPTIIPYNTRRFFPFLYKRYTFLRKLLFQFFFKLYLLYCHINFSFMFNLPQCNIMVVKIYSFLMLHFRFEVIIKELSCILCILLLSLVYSTLYCYGFIYGLLFVFARSTCYSSSLGWSLHIINRGIMWNIVFWKIFISLKLYLFFWRLLWVLSVCIRVRLLCLAALVLIYDCIWSDVLKCLIIKIIKFYLFFYIFSS